MRRIQGGYELTEQESLQLQNRISDVRQALAGLPDSGMREAFGPDVEVFAKAADFARRHGEFSDRGQVQTAFGLLDEALSRINDLRGQRPSWLSGQSTSGMVLRGYRSAIDNSVQPYGLELPQNFSMNPDQPYRLNVWLHGRDDSLSEIKFLQQRRTSRSPFDTGDAITLHPYGRYCNAYKFAGEVDVFEAIEAVCRDYPVDRDSIVLRGFSMGGGGVWHLAAHHADFWAAASPGAGFAETAEYLGLASKPARPDWERKLFQLYDATEYAVNFSSLPVIAYSGEVDKQIQAARVMESALAEHDMRLAHVIGAGMGHKYNPESIQLIDRNINAVLEQKSKSSPLRIRFTTPTLRYPSMHWFRATGLMTHWQPCEVTAELDPDTATLEVRESNLAAFEINFESGQWVGPVDRKVRVIINDQELVCQPPFTDRSWSQAFHRTGSGWKTGTREASPSTPVKRPGLQGPIDDAFLSRFIMIPPQGTGLDPEIHQVILERMHRFQTEWARQFRGDVPIVEAGELTDLQIASANLILFGDPQSHGIIRRLAPDLPFRWDARGLHTSTASFPSDSYFPVMIYPNPLNPDRYVVINSGITFDRTQSSSNADQTPKLPDYALIRVDPNGSETVSRAGFFDESWQLPRSP
jgi:pimeloyl-ACP methyl ester carboxylesterase